MRCPDVNVLLCAVNLDGPQQHEAVRAWLETCFSGPQGVGFAWAALLGFLRRSTRCGIYARLLSLDSALPVIHAWLGRPRASALEPTEPHASVLGRLLLGAGVGATWYRIPTLVHWSSSMAPSSALSMMATFAVPQVCTGPRWGGPSGKYAEALASGTPRRTRRASRKPVGRVKSAQ